MCPPGSSWNPTAAEQYTPLQQAFFQKCCFLPIDLDKHMPPSQYMASNAYFLYYKASLVLVGFLGFEFVFSDFFFCVVYFTASQSHLMN